MSQERAQPTLASEWVGDGDLRRDVATMSDRGIALLALDRVLRLNGTAHKILEEITDMNGKWAKEFGAQAKTLQEHGKALEAHDQRLTDLENAGGPRQSSHEWDQMLVAAGRELSARVKDPRDGMNSERARKIAEEVVETVTTQKDAAAFRKLKKSGWGVLWEILKIIVAAASGGGVVHFGLHHGK